MSNLFMRGGLIAASLSLYIYTLIFHQCIRQGDDMTSKERYRLTDKGKNILKNLKPTKCKPDFMYKLNERIDRIERGEE